MNKRIQELADQAIEDMPPGAWNIPDEFCKKFAQLIVQEYAKKTIQGLMSDPAFVQAMDKYYEQKWAHRFD